MVIRDADALHARLGPGVTYIVMAALANETARRFYRRHGLVEERRIPDGNEFCPLGGPPLMPALDLLELAAE